VRDYGRWQLTVLQRLLMIGVLVLAMFLGAMAWGWGRPELALVALFLLVGAGLAIFMLGLRYGSRAMVHSMAEVLSASPPPPRGVVGRCDMVLMVDVPGRGPTRVKLRRQVDVTRWPRAGMRLPVQLSARGQVNVRWQHVAGRSPATASTFEPALEPTFEPVEGYNQPLYTDDDAEDFYTEYRDGAFDADGDGDGDGGEPAPSDIWLDDDAPAPSAGPILDEPIQVSVAEPYFDDSFMEESFRDDSFRGEPPADQAQPDEPFVTTATTLHTGLDDGGGGGPGAAEPRIYHTDRTDTQIRTVDVTEVREGTGADTATPEERARAAGFDVLGGGPPLPRRTPGASVPGPVRAERAPSGRVAGAGRVDGAERVQTDTAAPASAWATRPPAPRAPVEAMSVLLVVSNVDRSVEFYRDMLGFTVEGQTSGGAVLSHGGGRIVLQRLTDMAPVDRRLIVVQISVPDVDAAYRRLKAQGVEFAQRPGWIRVGERLDLRTAKLHDPDGHAIQLVEGWQRGSGTR